MQIVFTECKVISGGGGNLPSKGCFQKVAFFDSVYKERHHSGGLNSKLEAVSGKRERKTTTLNLVHEYFSPNLSLSEILTRL